MEKIFSNLRNLAEDRHLPSRNRRHAEYHESNHRTSQSVENKGKLDDTAVKLVLLGLTGTGKSASANTILRKKQFVSKVSSVSVTTECQEAETEIDGVRVRVIDTPDIFDDEIKPSDKNKHVLKLRQLCQSGPCVYLLVMHVSRFTDKERDILKKMEDTFGSRVSEQTVVLFTRGDDLRNAEMSFNDFLASCQPELKKIIRKCGDRRVVFENRNSDSHQVKELMKTVNRVLKNRAEMRGPDQQVSGGQGCSPFSCILL